MIDGREISRAERLYAAFMREVGIDLKDPNASQTPRRVAKMFQDDFGTRDWSILPAGMTTLFPSPGDQYIAITKLPYSSLCSHHHLPHYGEVSIVYHPDAQIMGLSKFARIVRYIAACPCTQEELTERIAEVMFKNLHPVGVYVQVQGFHSCMIIRGVRSTGETKTSAVRGEMNLSECMELIR